MPAQMGIESRLSLREFTTAAATFSALTLALTYPQVTQLDTHVGIHYDALFSVWRLAWIPHQLPRDPLHLFDANIFHPEPNMLAYSDATRSMGLVAAPLIWSAVPRGDEDFAQSAKKAGIPYGKLLERMVAIGLQWQPTRMAYTPES